MDWLLPVARPIAGESRQEVPAMTRRKHSRPARDIAPVHPHAAAVDIGATLHVAAVRPGCDPEPVRTFGTFTTDLHRLADWFEQCGVETVAMESTGVYWIPLYEILDQRGFEVVVVNARDAKHVPGRKTDVSDAAWLQRLHEYGLLRASFRPKGAIATLRSYLRQRERLLEGAAAHIQHMQKALTEMNLQLHHVVADVTGVTGLRILRALVAGERDPDTLAAYSDPRCKAPAETLRAALVGNYREEPVFARLRPSSPWRRLWNCMISIKPRWPRATSGSKRCWSASRLPTRLRRRRGRRPAPGGGRPMSRVLRYARPCMRSSAPTRPRSTGSARPWRSRWWASAGRTSRPGRAPSTSPPG